MATKVESTKRILNQLRASASDNYKLQVPYIEPGTEIKEVSNPILKYSAIRNEFVEGLTNMIGLTIFTHLNEFKNPLAILKKGDKPTGIDVREIATDLVKASKYDLSDNGIAEALKLAPPVMAEAIHRVNRQEKYQLTISRNELRLALSSWEDLGKLIADKASLLYSSNYRDEFEYTKALLNESVNRGYIDIYTCDKITDEASGKKFVKTVKNLVSKFMFPSNEHNQLFHMDETKRITTWSKPEDLYVVTRADVMNNISVDVLAVAFNRDELTFKTNNVVEVDTLGYVRTGKPENYKYYSLDGMVFDKAFTQIYDDVLELWEMELAGVMAWNRFLHVWQTYSTSPFVCVGAICSEVTADEIPDGYFD